MIWTVAVGGVFGLLWWQGQIQRLAVYITETREELKKCSWPSWDELKGSTLLIIVMTAIFGLYIYVLDVILSKVLFHA